MALPAAGTIGIAFPGSRGPPPFPRKGVLGLAAPTVPERKAVLSQGELGGRGGSTALHGLVHSARSSGVPPGAGGRGAEPEASAPAGPAHSAIGKRRLIRAFARHPFSRVGRRGRCQPGRLRRNTNLPPVARATVLSLPSPGWRTSRRLSPRSGTQPQGWGCFLLSLKLL